MQFPVERALPLAACAAIAVTALSAVPATAATTTIHRDNATGAPYAGNWQISTVGPLNFSITFLGAKVTATCEDAKLNGTVTAAGAGTLATGSVGACTASTGQTSPAITFENLQDVGGQVTYAPVQGGRDGTLAVTGNLNFKLEGEILGRVRTCYYGFRTGNSEGASFDIYNGDNPQRPVPSSNDVQGTLANITLVRLPGSDWLCGSNGTGSGQAVARGETVSGSGVFDQRLYVTS
ncbi:hypothetical protein [Actinomadura rudentiformis]|uniref:Uncharacterized protein n=1 Tax=Actinomadura rudentiformis TaxID=359158 RepID=A0A6H9YKD5_9ACTN|nr:hypothetical protein [Actinomadura rudentiformis]KAB2347495.1 hypothetical protein F8566_21100 [Actinomadura rudentiformis]